MEFLGVFPARYLVNHGLSRAYLAFGFLDGRRAGNLKECLDSVAKRFSSCWC